ncbi:MAG: DUF5050 domain-containing protein [Clostridium sp.]|nr:DUF5050 domain-containing protein [Clostridium sp.]
MDDKKRAEDRKKRAKAKKEHKIGKSLLILFAIIVLAAATFLVTLKICDPDFTIESIVPQDKMQQAVSFIKEDILKQTTEATTKASTTKPVTTKPANYDYAEFDEFAFDTSMQGNQLGNLLNNTNGAVTYSSSYIYYSIDGKGIYRFEPNEEKNSKVNVNKYHFKCLNVLGDYIYFVDTDSKKLKRCEIRGGDILELASDISFAYLYNDKIYYVGSDNSIGYISTDDFTKTALYTAPSGKELAFVGISLSRVFFTQYDTTSNYYEYITVALNDSNDKHFFRNDTKGDEITNMQLECGFFYYYEKQSDDTYNLVRQKFGSEKTVTLIKKCTLTDYPVVYGNRLYYSNLSGSSLQAKELNMNSMEKKIMVTMSKADKTSTAGVGYGYQYVFLFGKPKSDAKMAYRGSCIYTSASSSNTIVFSGNGWKYN